MKANAISLRIPIVALVVAATAVPVELQPLNWAALSLKFGVRDVAANVAGYVFVGMVFADLGWARAMAAAATLSILAEATQLVMLHRVASLADIATNLAGAMVGVLLSRLWRLNAPVLEMNRTRGFAAAASALAVMFVMWARAGEPLNPRGVTEAGVLEAHWKLDETGGASVMDSSRRKLDGKLAGGVQPGPGILGGAMVFDGRGKGIYCRRDGAFRLAGSMTITAWIKSTAYPVDDAAVVSTLMTERGYQLDTTIDRGPRTIGFKLNNSCGEFTARYGATPLALGAWYHIAGVYDAERRTLDVYLNGVIDNGPLRGNVSGTQRSSGERLRIGRRRDGERGYEFAGSIDDVRIYSYALSQSGIAAVMRGDSLNPTALLPNTTSTASAHRLVYWNRKHEACGGNSDRADASIPMASGVLGVLVALALVGLFPAVNSSLLVVAGLVAGGFLFVYTGANLPGFNILSVPLTNVLCAASVAVSRRQHSTRL